MIFYAEEINRKKSRNLTSAENMAVGHKYVDAPETRSDNARRPSTSRQPQCWSTAGSGHNVTVTRPINSQCHGKQKAGSHVSIHRLLIHNIKSYREDCSQRMPRVYYI